MGKIGNTINSALQYCAEPKGDYFHGIRIRTHSGGVYEGSLAKWNPTEAPNLVYLLEDHGLTLIARDTIESIAIINPAG